MTNAWVEEESQNVDVSLEPIDVGLVKTGSSIQRTVQRHIADYVELGEGDAVTVCASDGGREGLDNTSRSEDSVAGIWKDWVASWLVLRSYCDSLSYLWLFTVFPQDSGVAERIRSKLRSFKEGIVAKKNGGIGAFKRRTRPLVNFFARAKRERVVVAKWLFEKLLGSFMISSFVLY